CRALARLRWRWIRQYISSACTAAIAASLKLDSSHRDGWQVRDFGRDMDQMWELSSPGEAAMAVDQAILL
ncbi:hypothetical protein H097_27050, partial [Pseudomonas sp. FH4]